ncbi:MAG TPA: hypothetical protein VIO94_17765 [Phenylobacterium sp.]
MPSANVQEDLTEAADEEIERACTLGWRQLSGCTPWGDTYEGFTPAGRTVCFERNYLWDEEAGGDIRVEVAVYEPRAFEHGVRLARKLSRES